MVQPFPLPNATEIVQQVVCVGTKRKPWCSARELNYIRTYAATVDVVDNLPPAVEILPDTPLATGAWVRGTQPLNYTASDNVGVQRGAAIIGGVEQAAHARAALLASPTGPFADPMPCPNGPGQISLRTANLLEGTQPVVVQAQDAAGNTAVSGAVTARIDNTASAARRRRRRGRRSVAQPQRILLGLDEPGRRGSRADHCGELPVVR